MNAEQRRRFREHYRGWGGLLLFMHAVTTVELRRAEAWSRLLLLLAGALGGALLSVGLAFAHHQPLSGAVVALAVLVLLLAAAGELEELRETTEVGAELREFGERVWGAL